MSVTTAPTLTILVVDDDEGMRYSLARDLKRAGYRAVEAADGAQALAQIAQHPDLVVLDVRLPDISGIEVCRRLRARADTAHIPVLHISAEKISAEDQAHGLDQGADGYLTHPVDRAVLIAWVKALLRIRAAERALNIEKERLAVTLNNIADAVITLDGDDTVQLMNPVAQSLTGWLECEARGKPLDAVAVLCDLDTRARRERAPKPALVGDGRAPATPPVQRFLLCGRDGSERIVEETATAMRNPDMSAMGTVVVLRDVTEKQRYEEAMIKTQKLESLGVLAGGIAHDFNNLLTGILGNVSLARVAGMDTQPLLADAERACLRARALTQQLLTFAKGGAPVKKILTLPAWVRETAEFALRGSHAQCEFAFASDLPAVEADAGQLAQVIHNLVLNAAEAMPDGGKISVRLAAEPATADRAASVRLSIIDGGTGIHAKHLPKIFDPYFTTKQKGSGLGLAVVYSIIKKHGGDITVESELGRGTAFHVFLPRATEVSAPTPSAALPKGRGRILLMDDEPAILKFTQRVLGELGYDTAVAADGDAALQLAHAARDAGTPFDLAILDLTVPGGMGGRECLDRLRASDPDMRAIAASGYSTDPIMCEPGRHGFAGVLAKPFLPLELANVVARVLPVSA